MSDHYPIHCGLVNISLGAMRREYVLLPTFLQGMNDPEVTRGIMLHPPVYSEEELSWYERLTQYRSGGSDFVYAILLQQRGTAGNMIGHRYIGHTGLHGIKWPDGYATTGSVIVEKECFGNGYGTEAKLLLLYEAFRNRGLRKVCSQVKAFNGNSWGHLLACGYKQVGRRKQHHFDNGNFVDEISFEIFRDDWEKVWQAYQESKVLPRLTEEQRAFLKKETSAS